MTLSTISSRMGKILSTGNTPPRIEGGSPHPRERRAYPRPKVRFEGTIDVEGRRIPVRGVDFHRAGARIAADYPLPTGAVVFFFAKSHGLMGWAKVRWCAWRTHRFHLGLEFRNPLMRAEAGKWQFSRVDEASNGVFIPPAPQEFPVSAAASAVTPINF